MAAVSTTGRRWVSRDVEWYVHGRKRPIAYSTVATSRMLGLMAEAGHTFASARQEVGFDQEARDVLDAHIARGLGDVNMAEHAVRY